MNGAGFGGRNCAMTIDAARLAPNIRGPVEGWLLLFAAPVPANGLPGSAAVAEPQIVVGSPPLNLGTTAPGSTSTTASLHIAAQHGEWCVGIVALLLRGNRESTRGSSHAPTPMRSPRLPAAAMRFRDRLVTLLIREMDALGARADDDWTPHRGDVRAVSDQSVIGRLAAGPAHVAIDNVISDESAARWSALVRIHVLVDAHRRLPRPSFAAPSPPRSGAPKRADASTGGVIMASMLVARLVDARLTDAAVALDADVLDDRGRAAAHLSGRLRVEPTLTIISGAR